MRNELKILPVTVGLHVVRNDDPDRDACADDYPFAGVVTGFSTETFGEAAIVQHGDYEERIRLAVFWYVYRVA